MVLRSRGSAHYSAGTTKQEEEAIGMSTEEHIKAAKRVLHLAAGRMDTARDLELAKIHAQVATAELLTELVSIAKGTQA